MTRMPEQIMQDRAFQGVIDAIEAGNKHAFLVGGAVRNALLGEDVDDMDIATDARPEQVTELAQAAGLRVVPTGIDHGTVTVIHQQRGFEVTTFRHDVETDGRHAVVTFTSDLAEDARRRDFTMNALYADRHGTVIDPVGGLKDLAARKLRFVGEPAERIREDYLRILRFFRFLAWYGREADPAAVAACERLRDGLSRIARERVGGEMRKLLSAPDPSMALHLMQDSGVLELLLPRATAADVPRLVAIEQAHGIAPAWQRRLIGLHPVPATSWDLRLSRAEAKRLSSLTDAVRDRYSLDRAGYGLEPDLAKDVAILRSLREDWPLPPDWQDQLRRAAGAPFPISARDLGDQLQGPALGLGLRAAQSAWIDSGFALPAPALIDIAVATGKERK